MVTVNKNTAFPTMANPMKTTSRWISYFPEAAMGPEEMRFLTPPLAGKVEIMATQRKSRHFAGFIHQKGINILQPNTFTH